MNLNMVVCLKVVPKPEEVRLDPVKKTLDRAAAENILNPSDKNALQLALDVKARYGGTVAVVSMGPPMIREHLALTIGMGADRAILLSDRTFAGADTYPTSRTLAAAAKRLGPVDIVLCGEESADSATGQVPAGIAEWLGFSQATFVKDIAIDGKRLVAKRVLGGARETLSVPLPTLVSVVVGANQPVFPDYVRFAAARDGEKVEIWSRDQLGLAPEEVGTPASHTVVHELVAGEPVERARRMVAGTPVERAAAVLDALKVMRGPSSGP